QAGHGTTPAGGESAHAGTDAAPSHCRGGGAGQDPPPRARRQREGRPLRPPFSLQPTRSELTMPRPNLSCVLLLSAALACAKSEPPPPPPPPPPGPPAV